MTLCTNCQSKIPTLTTRVRKVNEALYNLGLSYHESRSRVLVSIDAILEKYNFRMLGWNVSDRIHSEVSEGKWISINFHQMESGRL